MKYKGLVLILVIICGLLIKVNLKAEVFENFSGDVNVSSNERVEKPSFEKLAGHNFSNSSQFKCWQSGKLIVQEVNFQPAAAKEKILTRNNKSLVGYDFGETFCMYIGESK